MIFAVPCIVAWMPNRSSIAGSIAIVSLRSFADWIARRPSLCHATGSATFCGRSSSALVVAVPNAWDLIVSTGEIRSFAV